MQPAQPEPLPLHYAPTPPTVSTRTRVALWLAVPLGAGVGCGLAFAGFGFFPAWFLASLACPIALCLIATSRRAAVALLPAPAMMASFGLLSYVPPLGAVSPYTAWPEVLVILLLLTMLSEAMAFVIAMVFARQTHTGRG